MTFYERYAELAKEHGIDPCSQKAGELLGISKATISKWKTGNITPKGETIAAISNAFGVSADYLLGRTDDPTDFSKKKKTIKKTIPLRRSINGESEPILVLYNKLDKTDKLRAEGVIRGMLMQDKYLDAPNVNAAHTRTDIQITDEMRKHDNDIMDDDYF